MSRVIELKFPLLNGGRAGGINAADLETFSKDPSYYVARECAQNTLDAVDKTIGLSEYCRYVSCEDISQLLQQVKGLEGSIKPSVLDSVAIELEED